MPKWKSIREIVDQKVYAAIKRFTEASFWGVYVWLFNLYHSINWIWWMMHIVKPLAMFIHFYDWIIAFFASMNFFDSQNDFKLAYFLINK